MKSTSFLSHDYNEKNGILQDMTHSRRNDIENDCDVDDDDSMIIIARGDVDDYETTMSR